MNERAQLRKAAKYEQRDREMRHTALQACLASPDGRSLLWWLFSITKVESTPFSSDPQATAFQCGEQNIGIQLKAALIEADPQGYVKLLQEKASEREARSRDLDAVEGGDGPDNLYDAEPGDDFDDLGRPD